MGKTRGKQCCAFGCRKRWVKGARSDSEGSSDEESVKKRRLPRTFHRIPCDPERRKQWVHLIHRKDWIPTEFSRICSDHFFEKDMDRTGQSVRVRENAAPMRFKMFPKHMKENMKAMEPLSQVKLNDDALEVLPQSSQDQASLSKRQRPSSSSSSVELNDNVCDISTQNFEDEADFDQNLVLSRFEVCDILEALQRNSKQKKVPPIKKQKVMHDHAGYCLPSATELKKQLEKTQNRVCKLERKIKTLQQQSRRLMARMSSFKQLVKLLRKKNCISGLCEGHLSQVLSEPPHMI